ncbi:MBL fold metallo-hydrolase [Ancylobacter pratisalsi]|uniref:MBL fold metallo-hydrolase n=1 Tax=Ancylobacter pratisalsi TaxID=1745854 RepID=A0A6P1YIZ2_9HYPH|nr:MBL fold metallo-hydrolase [Ancylobacter pratisalsi]QIB33112.1 MBL fold metallo-hydrolase [Ancylobacter pratisalsi]
MSSPISSLARVPDAALPASVAEIVPGQIYAIGGGIPAGQSVSWLREDRSGWMPVQAYLLRSTDRALVIDCGLPVDAEGLNAGFDALLDGLPPPRLLISRWEPDAIAGLPRFVERYGVTDVLSYAGLNPLDFFEGFEGAAARSLVDVQARMARLVPVLPGETIDHGNLRLQAISPALRLLLTMWYYEPATRSLFTADAFGLMANPDAPCPFASPISAEALSPVLMRDTLLAKFDWFIGAHVEPIVAELEEMLARLDIERICPSIGGLIEGRPSVERVFAATIDMIRRLGAEKRSSSLSGFDWSSV